MPSGNCCCPPEPQSAVYPEGQEPEEEKKVREEENFWCWAGALCAICCPCSLGTSLNWVPCALAVGGHCCHTPSDKKMTIGVGLCCMCSQTIPGLIYMSVWMVILATQWPVCYHQSRINCGFCYERFFSGDSIGPAAILNQKRESRTMWSGHSQDARTYSRGDALEEPLFDDYYAWPYQTFEACAGGSGEIHPTTLMPRTDIGGSSATTINWTVANGFITDAVSANDYVFNTFKYASFFNAAKADGEALDESDADLNLLYVTNANRALDTAAGRRDGKNSYEMYCPVNDKYGDAVVGSESCQEKCDCLGGFYLDLKGLFGLLFWITVLITLPISCCLFCRMWKTVRVISKAEEKYHTARAMQFAASSNGRQQNFVMPGAQPQVMGAGLAMPGAQPVGQALVVTGTPAGVK